MKILQKKTKKIFQREKKKVKKGNKVNKKNLEKLKKQKELKQILTEGEHTKKQVTHEESKCFLIFEEKSKK